jgi:hypothetical protein
MEDTTAARSVGYADNFPGTQPLGAVRHNDGVDLCPNRILTRMAVPHSFKYAIARELLVEIRREIANRKPAGEPCGNIRKDTTLPDARRAQAE